MIVRRYVDIDAGHRVTRHESKCSNLHGHRYRLSVSVAGPIKDDESSEHGMVIDFSHIKQALMAIHDQWDHKFLLGNDDPLLGAMANMPGVVVLDRQPTAENLATIAAAALRDALHPLTVVSVNVQETATCDAEWRSHE